ncbi:PadR family transcriptional regulator [Brachybacterium phenoliresistens]|uniref:PadR family transcriptional regulator n=1 Tax=Brachybacterium phenoliresistens TaxID=396014 RepID=Z9JRX7_9MICO|nr:PadR family transcriptional regulator [Brachybacterium phenoliresistens]
MPSPMTEMLKGTLEGIVLAILAAGPAYGYEITARLREQGFEDLAEGTIYALLVRIEQKGLVDVEKVPSQKGPPRKVFTLNPQGSASLAEFWTTWDFLAGSIERLREPAPAPIGPETPLGSETAIGPKAALGGASENPQAPHPRDDRTRS